MSKEEIISPTQEMLQASVKNNQKYFTIFVVLALALTGAALMYRDVFLGLGVVVLFNASMYYLMAQKIDKARLELLTK